MGGSCWTLLPFGVPPSCPLGGGKGREVGTATLGALWHPAAPRCPAGISRGLCFLQLLNCIMDMVEKTRRSLTVLRRCQEADREELNHWIRRYSDAEDMKKGASPAARPHNSSSAPEPPQLGIDGMDLLLPHDVPRHRLCWQPLGLGEDSGAGRRDKGPKLPVQGRPGQRVHSLFLPWGWSLLALVWTVPCLEHVALSTNLSCSHHSHRVRTASSAQGPGIRALRSGSNADQAMHYLQ